jgi:hypothetical protein
MYMYVLHVLTVYACMYVLYILNVLYVYFKDVSENTYRYMHIQAIHAYTLIHT